MAEAILNLKRWGNDLGLRLPAAVARAANLHVDQRVRVSVEDGIIVITPVTSPPMSLGKRLALIKPERHGGEVMVARRVGTEQWVRNGQACVYPFLVLSPRAFNERTSLVIGLPMTTAECNADNPFAIASASPSGARTRTSYMLCHLPKSFDWRVRRARAHARLRVTDAVFRDVRSRVEQIMQLSTND